MPTAPSPDTIPLRTLESAADSVEGDAGLARALAQAARAVHASPAYSGWISDGVAERFPFRSKDALPPALVELGLAEGSRSLAKINVAGEHVFLTDGVWVDKAERVFPFTKESMTLTAHAAARSADLAPDLVVDLASGCGHSAIGYPGAAIRFSFDVNPRALAYARINRAMNAIPEYTLRIMANDIRKGVPAEVGETPASNVLFLANMPFGPSPSPGVLPLSSDGGETGLDLQVATLDAIGGFAETMGGSRRVRASVMALTLCNPAQGRWEVTDLAVERFGAERVEWTLLGEERLYHVDGRESGDNPSPLDEALPRIADFRLYFDDHERDAVRESYRELARSLGRRGWTHLAYGIVDIELGRSVD